MSMTNSTRLFEKNSSVAPEAYIFSKVYPLFSKRFVHPFFASSLYLELMHIFSFFGKSSILLSFGPKRHNVGFLKIQVSSCQGLLSSISIPVLLFL